jgi:outer membrane receptor protein involved in Fe transport
MKRLIISILIFCQFILPAAGVMAQVIRGSVHTLEGEKKVPLPFVNVHWLGTTTGTSTDDHGHYEIPSGGISDRRLVFSFVGYKTDTVAVGREQQVDVVLLENAGSLGEVVVEDNGGAFVSKLNARQVEVITQGELYRAACCNLSESFETNASVDVVYADAITGARQIQLLGLSGIYSQIISENVPLIRGLGSPFGLQYIPGSWMESIQVSKGASSVINGFESTTGQINVEYKKPATAERFFLNLFGNSNERFEGNIIGSHRFNDKLSTMVMGHYDVFRNKFDRNGDSFVDLPGVETVNIFHRWDYEVPEKICSRFGIKYMEEDRQGGRMDFNREIFTDDTSGIRSLTKSYGLDIKTRRLEAFFKNGFMFPGKPYKSVAFILSGIIHDQEGIFGLNKYEGRENSLYAQWLYQSRIVSDKHRFTTGLSFQLNDYREDYFRRDFTYLYETTGPDVDDVKDSLFTLVSYQDKKYLLDRTEQVPGAFLEYTFNPNHDLTVIAGIRADHHNRYGTFFTPRLHVKYHLTETTILRASAGKGYRTADVFVENFSVMASQRRINFSEELKQENAWNYGVNITKEFEVFKRKSELSLEVYRTEFISQVIADMDSLPSAVFFYNVHGSSFSNVFQVQYSFEPLKRFNIMAAFRVNDVRTTISGKLREKPLVNRYKGLITLSYATPYDKWKFDVTGQYLGPSRLPDTERMPVFLQRQEHSPDYINLMAQVTKKYKSWEFYVGGENLTNFTQGDPITGYNAPYHTYFDTSTVWGPLVGTTVYAGLRYTLK